MSPLAYRCEEEWLDVPGYGGLYQISNYGGVRSLTRVVTDRRGVRITVDGRPIKPRVQHKGHLRVSLSRDNKRHWFLVHRLVLMAFVGPVPADRPLGCHRDGNPVNNYVENLYWGTYSTNRYDAVRHGTHNMSRKTHCKQGHEFSPENTRISSSNGQRVCIECTRRQYKPKPKQPRLVCGKGHVLAEVGTYRQNSCRQCVRDWNKASRERSKHREVSA